MKRWIVIANCQAFGLANSIRSLARDIDCYACDLWQYTEQMRSDPDFYRNNYDFALISDEAREWFACDDAVLPPHIPIPNLTFSAFHPDCCYVHVGGQPLTGVVGPYHSLIAVAAYKEDIGPDRAAAFFRESVYEQAGYFAMWGAQREALIADFARSGIAIGSVIRRMSHGRAFMFTINHPRIEMLFEVARAILAARNEPLFDGIWPPPETLAGVQWPIYPEVGRRIGIEGACLFKPADEQRPIELAEFLERSHAIFGAWEKSQLYIDPAIRPRLRRIRQLMKEAA
jgi:hypothetical protein